MNHEVIDMSSALWQIYQEMDPCVLEEHVTQVRYSTRCCISEILIRVATCQGKVREKQNFLQVRELSGNFEKCQGILAI